LTLWRRCGNFWTEMLRRRHTATKKRRQAERNGKPVLPHGHRFTFMLSIRDELDERWHFSAYSEGREINFRLLSDDGQHIWITVKGENAHATEQLAESILRSLNPPPDLITDDVEGHTPKVEAT
ncbi:MAG TPA: hypothetical protein VHK03_14505, partial [Aestuariivirgaceae bacterium]|nr:hypothetical protein [Aestuariivirgaceae bacterium]